MLSVELTVAFKASDLSKTKGTVNNSSELFADKALVLKIVKSVVTELSFTSNDIDGVFDVLFVTLRDFIIIVSLEPDVSKVVSDDDDKLFP